MPDFVIHAGDNEPLTQASIVTELWDILETGSDVDDPLDKDVIEDTSWNMEPLQQESHSCSEEVRSAFYISLFGASQILSTWVT
jgi:hypothetical protein